MEFKDYTKDSASKADSTNLPEVSEEQMFEVTAKNIVEGMDMFREDAKDLSKKELYRLLCHIVEYPMDNTTKVKTGGKEELLATRARIIKDDQFILTVKFLQDEGNNLTSEELSDINYSDNNSEEGE
jgi:hypothetical protein